MTVAQDSYHLAQVPYPTAAAPPEVNMPVSGTDRRWSVAFSGRRRGHHGRLHVAQRTGVGVLEETSSGQ